MATVQERVREFADRSVEALGAAVECVVLAGSHARGDPRPNSDIDVWIVLSEISGESLKTIGRIVAGMRDGPEINPQCVIRRELLCPGFRKGFSPIQLQLDGVVLYGRLDIPQPSNAEIRQERDELAAYVLMSARHYVTVDEPADALRRKLDSWVMKPLVWAIRHDVFLRTGCYLKALDPLCDTTPDADSREMVQVYRQLRGKGFEGDCQEVLETAMRVCQRMLEEGGSRKASTSG